MSSSPASDFKLASCRTTLGKRKRLSPSDIDEPAASSKADLRYNDSYRRLYNEDVERAAARFELDSSFFNHRAQIGASKWSKDEKNTFFAALTKLGQHDTAGISAAIRTKSIAEVHELITLLRDGASNHTGADVLLRDIPAAIEVGAECSQALESAGDALAWFQERFEAKQEQERYGKYWLITPDIAHEARSASGSTRSQSRSVSARPSGSDGEAGGRAALAEETPQILRDLPEAVLLDCDAMLELSALCFMNGSSAPPSPYPHWSTYSSPIAAEPSIYRTALKDLYALVVSLTKRVMQASIIQATSRIRSQAWRGRKKAAQPRVRTKDVHTAVDMLRLPRDGNERWKGLARRCRLRVIDGKEDDKKELSWAEVEDLLSDSRAASVPDVADELPALTTSEAEWRTRSSVLRSATPLPEGRILQVDSDDDSEFEEDDLEVEEEEVSENEVSKDEDSPSDTASQKSEAADYSNTPKRLTIEEFDHAASVLEEASLWNVLGLEPSTKQDDAAKAEDGEGDEEDKLREQKSNGVARDIPWRDWTEFHAEWEDFRVPVPQGAFRANHKRPSPGPLPVDKYGASDLDVPTGMEDSDRDRSRKRQRVVQPDLPIRGARAYAALQRVSLSEDREIEASIEPMDDADVPAPSVEESTVGMTDFTDVTDDDSE